MDLTSEAVANVLEFGDAKTSPARRKFGVLLRDTGEESVCAVEVGLGSGANHEGTEECASLEVLFTYRTGQRSITSGRTRSVGLFGGSETVEGSEDFVGDFGLDSD